MIDIRLDVKSDEKLDFVDNLEKITKVYAQGTSFVSSTGVTITQKTLTTADMKAEVQQNGKTFLNWVKQHALRKGFSENDISGTLFEEIVLSVFLDGLRADLVRQIWFGDTVKETVTSDIPTGAADVDFNVYLGFWERIVIDIDSATIAASQFTDINSTTYLDTAAVAEVDTVTLTGTAGTANITFNGTAYLATFDTSLTITATNFVTSHAATILARMNKVVVTSSGADVIFTAGIQGAPQTTSAAVNATGNLAGSVAETTANVATGTIKTGGALAALSAVYNSMPSTLKSLKSELRFMVTASVADNFRDSMESPTAGSESAYTAILDGVKKLAYRGIPIVEMLDWDDRIDTDFGSVRPHRILLTWPMNLVAGMDGASDDLDAELFYDQTTQNNVFRVEYKMGTQYLHEPYICAAYA